MQHDKYFEIKRIDDFKIIESFLENTFSSPTHWPDWNIITSNFFSTEFFYVGYYNKAQLIGVCPLHEYRKKRLLKYWRSGQFHCIPYGGWIFNTKIAFNPELIKRSQNTILNIYSLPELPEFNVDYLQNGNTAETLIIELENDMNDIWNDSIDSKRRNMIKKAEKNQIQISSQQIFDHEFYNLYKDSSERNHLTILPYEFFTELLNHSRNIKFEILKAQKEGENLANIVLAYDKNYAIYWLGNNSGEKNNDGQGELLQWYAIKAMKGKGCKYYDLCYINKNKLPHIYRFKKGFSDNVIPIKHIVKKSIAAKVIGRFIG
jgi:hypothetical protein